MSEHPPVVLFDFETERMAVANLAPKAVCLGAASRGPDNEIYRELRTSGDPEERGMRALVDQTILNPAVRKAAHNAAFDMAVACSNWPEFLPRVFEEYEAGRIHCTIVREKLLNLTRHGSLATAPLPGGGHMKVEYNLAALTQFHLGRDRSHEKKAEDGWRLNFAVLDGVPVERWPADAVAYVMDDVADPLQLFELQEQRRAQVWQETGIDPFATEAFRTYVDFCLFLVTCWGVSVDPEMYHMILGKLSAQITPERLPLLYEYGIVTPAQPPRPHKKGAKNKDGTPKMTAAIDEKESHTKLRAYIKEAARLNPAIVLKTTEASTKFPEGQISFDSEWLEEYAHFDPLLTQYHARAKLKKMLSTELPRMCTKDDRGNSTGIPSPVVHACFDCLKETGRTSSYGTDNYPSFNGQNVDPEARPCYVPRPGNVLFSVDISQMELCTLAQKCYELFGFSMLRDLINAGVDLHEHLGAQLAYTLNPQFAEIVNHHYRAGADPAQIREVFATMKQGEGAGFYQHFRKFAKPTNLGYPGGLAEATFVAYAKGTYGVVVSVDEARRFREVWMATLPEMKLYFQWINESCQDPRNGPLVYTDPKTGQTKRQTLYAYTTPFGMYRAGAVYCAAANGAGMQSPSSEGALTGFVNVVRACYDPAARSILGYDEQGWLTRCLLFIHDEIFGETRDDAGAHDRVQEIARIMVAGMKIVTPDVRAAAAACLMRRWYKDAKPVFDANGRLIPWEPKK